MKPKVILHCYCCGESYERGHFRCCAPPKGTPSHVWLGHYCTTCGKCPQHCVCDVITPRVAHVRPLAQLAKQTAASLLSPEERLRRLSLDRTPSVDREWLPHPDD